MYHPIQPINAPQYGDREVDLAMTRLFGMNPPGFYQAYRKEWELPEGFQIRETIYNLYHILNHYVLFGGGYLNQAHSMIHRIMTA
jgi:fructosamine-3-kinase